MNEPSYYLKAFGLLWLCNSLCQALPAQQSIAPLVYSLSEKNGLTDNDVTCFFRDSRNIMWMGTNYGLNSYDGSVILNYHTGKTGHSLADESIHDIKEDETHTLWIATGAGLNSYDLRTKTFHTWLADSSDPVLNRYYSLAIAGSRIYLATERGLMEFDRGQHRFLLHSIVAAPPEQNRANNFINKVMADSRQRIWLASYNGVWQYDAASGRFTSYDNPSNDPLFSGLVTDIFEDHSHRLWFGTWHTGLKRLDEATGKVENFMSWKNSYGNSGPITEQQEGGQYHLLVGHETSQMDSSRNVFYPLSIKDRTGKINASSSCLYCDKDNLLWMTTEEGVRIYNPSRQYFRNTVFSDGKPVTSQGATIVTLPGSFIVGGENDSLLLLFNNRGERFDNLSSRLHLTGALLAVRPDTAGHYWICSSAGIIVAGQDWRPLRRLVNTKTANSPLPTNFINDILFHKNGSVWAFPWRRGIWEMGADGRFRPAAGSNGRDTLLYNANIARAVEDRLGNTWLTDYEGGLLQYNAASRKTVPVLGSHRLTNEYIVDDTLWTVGQEAIIAVDIHGTKVCQFPLPPGKNKFEFDFIPEGHHIWIATKTGLLVFDRLSRQFKSFTMEDGLFADIMDGSLALLSNGNLVFAGTTYTTIFPPSIADQQDPNASLLFTAVYAGGQEKALSGDAIDIGYNEKNIGFRWALQHYSNPLNNQYYYKLDGVDNDWQPAGRQGQVNYNSLAPGMYLFHYRAVTSDGMASKEQSIPIHIHPPFWKTAWFITCSSLLLMFLFYIVVRYVSQRTLREQLLQMEKEQAIEKERHRISRDIHDDLGSGLTKIAILSEVVKQQLGEPAKAKLQLETISESSRELVDNLQDIIWVLNRDNDTLEILATYIRVAGLKFFEPLGINIQFNYPVQFAPGRLSEELRRNVFLAVKETFHNIGKHACCSNVDVVLEQKNGKITVEISDDGKGFNPEQVRVFANGLKNIRSRIEQLGGQYSISPAAGKGTVTRIEVAG